MEDYDTCPDSSCSTPRRTPEIEDNYDPYFDPYSQMNQPLAPAIVYDQTCPATPRRRPQRPENYDASFDPYGNDEETPEDDSGVDKKELYALDPWWDTPQTGSSGYYTDSGPRKRVLNEYSLPTDQKRRPLRFRDVQTPSYDYLEYSPPRRKTIHLGAKKSVPKQSLPAPQYLEFSPPRRGKKGVAMDTSPQRRTPAPVYMEVSPPRSASTQQSLAQQQRQMQRVQEMQYQRMQQLRQRWKKEIERRQREEARRREVDEADLLGLDTPDEQVPIFRPYVPQRLLFDEDDTPDMMSFE